jgi:hypothetical protein
MNRAIRIFTLSALMTGLFAPAAAEAAPGSCFGRTPTMVGTNGNDHLVGTPGKM